MNLIQKIMRMFLHELSLRKKIHSFHFSLERLTKNQNKRIEGICRELLELSKEYDIEWELVVRVFLNYAFPIEMSHTPLNCIHLKWNEFLQEIWSEEMASVLKKFDLHVEKGVVDLIGWWNDLPESVWLREKYVEVFQCGDIKVMTKFQKAHVLSPSWYKFICLYLFLTEEGEKFGLMGSLQRKMEQAVFAQYFYLRSITNAVTVNMILTVKGRERLEQYATRGAGDSVVSDGRSFAKLESRERMAQSLDKMLKTASGNKKPSTVRQLFDRI